MQASKEKLQKGAAEFQANLTRALKVGYRDAIREEEAKRHIHNNMTREDRVANKLKQVVQDEVNKYLEEAGLPCRVNYKIANKFSRHGDEWKPKEGLEELDKFLKLGKPLAQSGDMEEAAQGLMDLCNGMFGQVHNMMIHAWADHSRSHDSGIPRCVINIMKSVAKFALSSALFMGAWTAGMSFAGGTALSLGTLTIPPIGAAVLGALALAGGAYTMKGVVQDLFLGRTATHIDSNYWEQEYHIPGQLSELSTRLSDAWHGMYGKTRENIESGAKKIAKGEESQVIKVAEALVEYCSKFEQKGQSAGR